MAQVCKLFWYTATQDCLYDKFEELCEESDSEGMGYLRKWNRNDEIDKLRNVNPCLITRSPPRKVTMYGNQTVSDIPEEESEWNYHENDNDQKNWNNIQKIISDFRNECELNIINNKIKRTYTSNKLPILSEAHNFKNFNKQVTHDSKDKLLHTMVFSEQMGDAYTDSQHLNDGIMTVNSRDLVNSPYNFNKIKVIQPSHDGSVYMFKKMTTNGDSIRQFQMKTVEPKSNMSMYSAGETFGRRLYCTSATPQELMRTTSNNNQPSYPSSKNIQPMADKRMSEFVRLDFGYLHRPSKMSINSFQKQSTLKSIVEEPRESFNFDDDKQFGVGGLKNLASKRNSAFQTIKPIKRIK